MTVFNSDVSLPEGVNYSYGLWTFIAEMAMVIYGIYGILWFFHGVDTSKLEEATLGNMWHC